LLTRKPGTHTTRLAVVIDDERHMDNDQDAQRDDVDHDSTASCHPQLQQSLVTNVT